ncbi:hypothetical protein M407DRAFT_29214 [Tulasnella calospora MUT 4182]|uniref:CobW/HypB/UreG nucleotide-binding domain-containing protein n=1 Tax=Tulasnella calospora MUT 4182 TaxID=1051891 RepID=A0A0C3Q9C1_9AGAM|nr:hypothetical protein M407DRAFT_29214 [Tulasnella calospora MUT 4182]
MTSPTTATAGISAALPPIPVTVFTGFLGSGKTTLILSLLPKLPKDYRVVLLKNEFGDVEVDSQLVKQSSLTAVSEILNGCMCCVLVGQMKTALLEIRDKFRPDRIMIESSGSAFPATLAFQIRELERETGDFKLDAIVTVIDAENFTGYEDTSVTAKMQAQYSDLILVNKWNLVSERQLDTVMDHLFTLNESTPKLRCDGKSGDGVDPSLIFGLDSKLWLDGTPPASEVNNSQHHHSEVETATVRRGGRGRVPGHAACRDEDCAVHHQHHHAVPSPSQDQKLKDGTISKNTEMVSLTGPADASSTSLTKAKLEAALSALPKESVYRVKGFVRLVDEPAAVRGEFGSAGEDEREAFIVNWAFGRCDLVRHIGERGGTEEPKRPVHHCEIGASRSSSSITAPPAAVDQGADVLLTIMGEPGEVKRLWAKKLAEALDAVVE